MVSFKRAMIFSLLFVIFISTQNTIALSYLPESSHYSGKQYRGVPGDWIRIEFAVYDNYGQEFIDADYELPSHWETPGEYLYAYQVINEVTSVDITVDFFTISGIGKDAMASSDYIGWVGADPGEMEPDRRGQSPEDGWLALDEEEVDDDGQYFSSACWEFGHDEDYPTMVLENGEHSYFLLITSDHDFQAGTYGLEAPEGEGVPAPGAGDGASEPADVGVIPIPEPCTAALIGLGSVLLLKKTKKKITK